MAVNSVRIREKPFKRRSRRSTFAWVFTVAIVAFAAFSLVWHEWYYGKLGVFAALPVVESNQNGGRIIRVPPGGNLQAAIDQATSGDVIELQAGAVYAGQINLANKPLTDYVTIRSSGFNDLPADKRVSPAQRTSMATIQSGMIGRAAVAAANGAHHYRFIGIEFTATGKLYNYGVVVLGGRETRPEQVPHHIEIDRSYIHPTGNTVSRRGIALNSADTVIKNSYIEGFAFQGEETQGICGWTGTRNVKVLNNYVEGGAENIMFGGSDVANAELIPRDIVVRGNHLNKQRAWVGKATLKTLFELKNSKNVEMTGNLLTNNWVGSAFRITVRNETGGSPYATIEDTVIKDNIIDGTGDGINILGRDNLFPSDTLKRLQIVNNLFLNLNGEVGGFDGSGYLIQVADGEGITIANNTAFNNGNVVTFYGTVPRGFDFKNNIVGVGNYGIFGAIDLKSDVGRAMFTDNVFMNLNGIPPQDYIVPPNATVVGGVRDVGFADVASGDFRLSASSKYKGVGSNLVSPPR